jgi:hypothetical protein
LSNAGVKLQGWCLMTNHVYLVAVSMRENSLTVVAEADGDMHCYNADGVHRGICGRTDSLPVCSTSVICGLNSLRPAVRALSERCHFNSKSFFPLCACA